jgi:uncharacterized protein (TIGR02271 family)
MFDHNVLQEGMTVRSSEGDKLGKIVALTDAGIHIEKGIFFPKEFLVHYEQVADLSGDDVYLKWGTDLVETNYDRQYGAGSYRDETADESAWTDYRRPSDESIPLKEEELTAERHMRKAGQIRIHKTVRTEEKHFTVPVKREHVTVERVPASEATKDAAATSDFGEDVKTIPIHEEEVEVTKRPVVKEELRVKKTEEQVGKEVGGTVRKEEAHVEKSGKVSQRDKGSDRRDHP